MARTDRPKTALVLAGGGARGAYDAGVLSYLRTEVAREIGHQPRFDIICGTSVGAINACFIAATAHDPVAQASTLADIWGELDIEDVFRLPPKHLLRVPRWLLGGVDERMSLLRAEPLEQLVAKKCPWSRIRKNIAEGRLEALTVSTTEIATGKVVVFVDGANKRLSTWLPGPHTEARAARIGPRHALASAAIPLVFPAVPVDGRLHCDGGLRQNTPLRPALNLGAERILVVSLRYEGRPGASRAARAAEREARAAERDEMYPSAPFIFGKLLNALLIDQVAHDLDRLEQFNALIAEAEHRFGSEFVERLRLLRSPLFGTPFRPIDDMVLRPGADIGVIARSHLMDAAKSAGGLAGRLLKSIAKNAGEDEDLGSYLLFHGPYARDLIELARQDCRRRHDALCTFFAEE